MIFVTLGTQKYQFKRLIEYIDETKLENVIIQKGYTKFKDNEFIKTIDYIDKDKMQELINKSDFVISHGGITIIEILKMGKKLLVVPRNKKYREHINNHQYELCEILEKEGYLLVARNKNEFKKQIKKIKYFIPKEYKKSNDCFFTNLNIIINNILN